MLAADFIHVDTDWLRRIYALIIIEHGTRRPILQASPHTPMAPGLPRPPVTS